MNGDGFEQGRGGHEGIVELLAWYANGTLEEAEASRVQSHLEGCEACREELAKWQSVSAASRLQEVAWTPPADHLERLMARIDAEEEPARAGVRAPARAGERVRGWLEGLTVPTRWVLATQSALVAGLAGVILLQGAPPESPSSPGLFETRTHVAAQAPALAQLRVAFAEDLTEVELRRLLRELDASIVEGPSALGVYGVALASGATGGEQVEALLAGLRASPAVRFAEPVGAAPR